MAISYTLTKVKGQYRLYTPTLPLQYEITKNDDSSNKVYMSGSLGAPESVDFSFKIDGEYNLKLTQNLVTEDVTILSYDNILNDFIGRTNDIMCGCKDCKDFDDCAIYEVMALGQILYSIGITQYQAKMSTICLSYMNIIEHLASKYSAEELVIGKGNLKKTYLYLVAMYYNLFYEIELASATNQEEIDYVNSRYNYAKIQICMENKGLLKGITSVETPSSFPSIYYWQVTASDTINTVSDSITNISIQEKPKSTLAEFTLGKSVTYYNFGKIVFAIKETSPSNYIIKDALNIDVTEGFDTQYSYETKTLLFVSKNPYIKGTMTLKLMQG